MKGQSGEIFSETPGAEARFENGQSKMDELLNDISSLNLAGEAKNKNQVIDEINSHLSKIEITPKVQVQFKSEEKTSNVEVKTETDQVKFEPKDEFESESESDDQSDDYNDNCNDDSSDDSNDDSRVIPRGPFRPGHTNVSPRPYTIPRHHYVPNIVSSPPINVHPELTYNIPAVTSNATPLTLTIPSTEEQNRVSSQLLLSGGGRVDKDSPEVEAAQVNQVRQSLISDDLSFELPSEYFNDLDLNDYDIVKNDMFDFLIEQGLGLEKETSSFVESLPNSPYSTASSDQVVYSPNMIREDASPWSIYPSTTSPGFICPSTTSPGFICPSTTSPGFICPSTTSPGFICPSTTSPGFICPSTTSPGFICPSTTSPGFICPSTTSPGFICPSTTSPGSIYPSTTSPGSIYPSTTSPGSIYPSTTSPGSIYPSTTSPGSIYPSTTSPGSINPSITSPAPVDIDGMKYTKILPKPDSLLNVNVVSTNFNNFNEPRKIGPRNKYLNLDKRKRDAYHKRILTLTGKGLGTVTRDGFTILHTLIADRQTDFAIYFLDILKGWMEKNPNHVGLRDIENIRSFVDTPNLRGQTALYLATLLNQKNVVAYLLDVHSANIRLADNENGDTPFHVACQLGDNFLQVVRVFCENKDKFDLQLVNYKGRTALHESVRCHGGRRCHSENDRENIIDVIDNLRIVKTLLHAGARIDVQDEDGFTPVHFAIKNKCLALLDVLYENGALCHFHTALTIKDNCGRTPAMLTREEDDDRFRMAAQKKLCMYQ